MNEGTRPLAAALRALATGIFALVLAAAPGPVRADDENATDRVSFAVESSREVENDWARAVVGVTEEGPDPAELADRVNEAMTWALQQARAAQGVQSRSGAYNTHPVYEKSRVRRWRASQDLILESRDATSLSALVGTLQSRLQLRSIGFSVSDELRRQTEAELTREALAAFQARAKVVQEGLGRRGYSLVNLHIHTGGARPPLPPHQMRAMASGAMEVAPPVLEGGTSRLQVSASGTIELE